MVAEACNCGRRQAREFIREGRVFVDGGLLAGGRRLRTGQEVRVIGRSPAPIGRPESAVRVVRRARGLIVLAKPAGLHSVAGRSGGSVADWLAALDKGQRRIGSPREAGLVHRLDQDTSGILLAATTDFSFDAWRSAFSSHRVEKHYLALVDGLIDRRLEIDTALARRRTRVVPAKRRDRPLAARSEIEPLDSGSAWTLVLAKTRSGAPHQIRAHLAWAGHPLIGDRLYGGPPAPAGTRCGHLLHALRLRQEPQLDVTAAVADDFVAAYAKLQRRLGEG